MTRPAMAQGDLYLLLPLAWQAYSDHLAAFSAYKPAYTAKVADDGLKLLKTARELPDDQTRGAATETTRLLLVPQLTEYLDAWLRLDGYIEDAYAVGYKPMREEAGEAFYAAATAENWDSVTRLITNARAFVAAHSAELAANDNMPPSFPALLEAEAQDVEGLLQKFLQFKGNEQKGTEAKDAANAAAYGAWQRVARDADRIWRRQPETAKYFQTEYLLGVVRGAGQAGLRGLITLPDGTPAAGVRVEVKGVPDAATETDADGRYTLAVAAGTYLVGLSGTGYEPLDIANVEVAAGVKKRVDGVVKRG